jgi:hypothetical protein
MTERVASQAGTRERRERRARHPFLLLDMCPSPLGLEPLSISLILVPMCLAAVRRGERARGERGVSAGTRKLIVLSLAPRSGSGPGHEGEERGEGERRGGGLGWAKL